MDDTIRARIFAYLAEVGRDMGCEVYRVGGMPDLIRYIERQEEHHKIHCFQDEFRQFLQKYGISFDERYLWD